MDADLNTSARPSDPLQGIRLKYEVQDVLRDAKTVAEACKVTVGEALTAMLVAEMRRSEGAYTPPAAMKRGK